MGTLEHSISCSESVLESMKCTALEVLRGKEKGQYAQAVVIVTAKDREYSIFIENALSPEKASEQELISRLTEAGDTQIRYILCLWQDGWVDIPSYDFRNMLCQLNPENSNAGILVTTEAGCSLKKLGTTRK